MLKNNQLLLKRTYQIQKIVISPDGKSMAMVGEFSDDQSMLEIRDIEIYQNKKVLKLRKSKICELIQSVIYSPCGKYILTIEDSYTIRLWNAGLLEQCTLIGSDYDNAYTAAFTTDSNYIVLGQSMQDVRFRKRQSLKESQLKRIICQSLYKVTLSPRSSIIALLVNYGKKIEIWDYKCHKRIRTFIGNDINTYLDRECQSFSNDGKLFASVMETFIIIWDIVRGKKVISLEHNHFVRQFFFTPNGNLLISEVNSLVYVWQITKGKEAMKFLGKGIEVITCTPDGQHLITVQENYQIYISDIPKFE